MWRSSHDRQPEDQPRTVWGWIACVAGVVAVSALLWAVLVMAMVM